MGKHKEKLRKKIAFTIETKRIKYLGVYLPKETKDLCIKMYIQKYIENYKTLIKEIKDDTNSWRDIQCC